MLLGCVKVATAEFHLYATDNIYSALDGPQCVRLQLLFQEYGSSRVEVLRIHRSVGVCCAFILQMDHALRAKKLGKWASLQQQRITFLPYQCHRAPREIRRLAYVHHWRICITPPAFVIYYKLRHWACSDVAPGILTHGTFRQNHWLHQHLLRLIKEIKHAQWDRDFCRVTSMQA